MPNNICRLLSNVNLAKDYNNTFSWGTLSAQTNFFLSKQEGDLVCTDFTYTRENGTELGTIRFPANAERLQNVNYLMYQNKDHSDKWYYAFIDSVEYVNPGMSLIHFKLDSWQTYYFDIVWRDCLIGREHVETDGVGVSRLDEDIDTGVLHEIKYEMDGQFDDYVYMTAVTKDASETFVTGAIQTGVYSGLQFQVWLTDGALNGFISSYASRPDDIVAIFTFPRVALSGTPANGDIIDQPDIAYVSKSFAAKTSGSIWGYTPRNKKCYQFPYNYLEVSNNRGGKNIYHYEDWDLAFTGGYCTFVSKANVGMSPTVYLIPTSYKNSYENPGEAITLSDYPLCAWSYDAFKSWLAQNQVSNALSVAGSAVSIASGVMTKSPMAVATGILGFAQTIGGIYEKQFDPNPMKGSPTGGAAIAAGLQTFRFAQKAVTLERLQIIDNYFHMYGYKVNRVGTPNIRSRSNWNYLQLIETNVFGAFPASNLQEIRNSLTHGITFWHNDAVGSYNRANT